MRCGRRGSTQRQFKDAKRPEFASHLLNGSRCEPCTPGLDLDVSHGDERICEVDMALLPGGGTAGWVSAFDPREISAGKERPRKLPEIFTATFGIQVGARLAPTELRAP